jgi:DNA-binding transcriptional regulator YiaG
MKMTETSPAAITVRKLRTKLKLTQEDAAALVMASARTFRAWEAGDRNMPAAKWQLLKMRANENNA